MPSNCKFLRYHPNLEPSYDFSYLIGAYLTDGSTYTAKRNSVIRLGVQDRDFAEAFGRILASILKRNEIPIQVYHPVSCWTNEKSTLFVVAAGSRALLEYLEGEEYKKTVSDFPFGFLSGFLDGDGSVSYIYVKGHKYWRLIFTFGTKEKELLELVRGILNSYALHVYQGYHHSPIGSSTDLVVYRKAEVRFLAENLSSHILRKQERLEEIKNS